MTIPFTPPVESSYCNVSPRNLVPFQPSPPPYVALAEPTDLSQYGIRTYEQLKQRCADLDTTSFLIADLIPQQSLTLTVGDSGLGKSPFWYQGALCVASGLPFLDYPTRQGKALYFDFENGISEVESILSQLSKHLGLSRVPSDLLLWNLNDSPDKYGQPGWTWKDAIKRANPTLVVIDSLSGVFGDLEESNTHATAAYRELREIMQEFRCAVIGIHHTRKQRSGDPREHLEDAANPRAWFDNARGPRVMINGADVRLGFDVPKTYESQAALVTRGFQRVHGEIPLIHIARHLDEDGEPLGYSRLQGKGLLNASDLEMLGKLATRFRYKEAEMLLGGDSRKTTEFLGRATAARVVDKPPARKGYYTKRQGDPANHPAVPLRV